jgi:lipopolysaccharide heptosyltransferase II
MYRTNPVIQPLLFIIDAIGCLLFSWLRLRRLKGPKRILLIRLEHVGDVLLATPAFKALRKRYPDARIDVLAREFTAPILKGNRNVDRVITWNAPWLSKLGKKAAWSSVPRMVRALRKEHYDLAVDFHGDIRNILLASTVAHYRIGFGARGFGFLLNKTAPYRGHTIDRNLGLAKTLGSDVRDRAMELHVSQGDGRFARSHLKGKNWACIAPGSGRPEKNWVTERWAALADRMIEQYGVKIALTGSQGEAILVKDIISKMRNRGRVLDLSGKTSLAQLAAVVKQCTLVVCPDSGTMHIARALEVPVVGLFTVENPREWGYDEPRYQHVKGNDITVEAVMGKISQAYHKI